MVIELLVIVIPLCVGRFTLQTLRIPARLQHDPLAMMIGLAPYLMLPDLIRSYSTWSWALRNIGRLPLRVLGMILLAILALLYAMMTTGYWFTVLIDGHLATVGPVDVPALVVGAALWYLIAALAKVGLLTYVCTATGFESPLLPLEEKWIRFTEDFCDYQHATSSGIINEDVLTRGDALQLNLTASTYLPIIQRTFIVAPVISAWKYFTIPILLVGLIELHEKFR